MSAAAAQLVLPTPLAEAHTGWPFITALSTRGVAHRTEAVNLNYNSFRWYTSWGYSEQAMVADEGVDWCLGWHAGDSAEVQAMKVARALGPDSAMDLHEAEVAFINGTLSEKEWRANLDLWDATEGRR